MIVNLATLRQQRTSPTLPPEFEPGDPRRLNPLSLEQQRKRAKEFLRALQSGDEVATTRLHRHVQRSVSADFSPRLSDAQLVIARENGFTKWTDLKAHTDHIRIAQQALRQGRPSALDGGCRTLHMRCGNDIMHKLAIAGFDGDFLTFPDPYIEGPVPRCASLEEFVRIRAKYIEAGHEAGKVFDELYQSYRDLERAKDYDAVHIWMEHDSYDQLSLAKMLDFFCDPTKRPPRLKLISVTHFPGIERFSGIGQLPPEALRVLWNDFTDVDEHQLSLGQQVWQALTSPSPEALAELARTQTPALPTMGRALARHLRELPSTTNGLSLTEQLTLQILAEMGPMNAARLFGRYTNHYELLPFMGDSSYWAVLRRLANTERPAIKIDERADMPTDWKRDWQVSLLPFGEELLENKADWVALNTFERWMGGVHIDSRQARNWRIDENGNVLQE